MTAKRRLIVLTALVRAAEEKQYRGTEEPLVKLAIEYGDGDKVTREEVVAVLASQVSEIVSLGLPRDVAGVSW